MTRDDGNTRPTARPRNLARGIARRTAAGFTLIELMLVLAILTALAVVVVPRITGQSKKAKIGAAVQGINNLKTSLKSFEIHCDRFPTTSEGLQALITEPGNVFGWAGPYIEKQSVPTDPWNNPYQYRCPPQHGIDYDLYSWGPDGQDGTEDDITSWDQTK